jgi:hypothetical protein
MKRSESAFEQVISARRSVDGKVGTNGRDFGYVLKTLKTRM